MDDVQLPPGFKKWFNYRIFHRIFGDKSFPGISLVVTAKNQRCEWAMFAIIFLIAILKKTTGYMEVSEVMG